MKTLFVCALIASAVECIGQTTPPILEARVRTKGIYKTYAEFINNAPSLHNDFNLKTRSDSKDIAEGKAHGKLQILDSAVSKRDLKTVWGFCDGKEIYVNEYQVSGRVLFRQLTSIGRYCYLLCGVQHTTAVPVGGLVVAAPSYFSDEYFILNINNGKLFQLKRDLMLTILEKDPELLAQYKTEPNPRMERTLLAYIKKFNEKHAADAKLDYTSAKEVYLLRRAKDAIRDTFSISLDDSLRFQFPPPSLQYVKTTQPVVTLCAGDDCQTFFLSKREVNYIQVIHESVELPTQFVQLNTDNGEFLLREVQSRLRKIKQSPK